MAYRFVFSKHASRSFNKLPAETKKRIEGSLLRIQVRPLDFVEKIVNHPYYKLRVGDYRIIMDVIEKDIVILVLEVGHRKNIYKRF